jgi:CheY-like chemotaxis protein
MNRAELLVVEDDNDIRESLLDYLSFIGFKAVAVTNGQEALSYLRENLKSLPDLILLDYMMPVMNGMTFLNAMEKESPSLRIPVILISAATIDDVSFPSNVVEFMKKPFNLKDLTRTARKYLGGQAS